MLNWNLRKTAYLLLMACLPTTSFGDTPDLNRFSDFEHWEQADVIAFVEIQSGSYLVDVGFDLVAKPHSVLKGRVPENAKVSVRFPSITYPDRLGSTYLLFLHEDKDGVFRLMRETHSAISVLRVDHDSEQELRRSIQLRSSKPVDWYDFDGLLWVIECTTNFDYGEFCEDARRLAALALEKADGTKGR